MAIFAQKRPRYGEDPNFVPNTVIGEGVTVMGGIIKGVNSVMVGGIVFGDINVDGEVIVTDTGYVKGNIVSTFAVIAGIVEGNLQLSSYASLKSTASVTGDVSCTAISIDDGAIFSGACNMIVKSGAINKKMKRINEQAISALDEQARILKSSGTHDGEDFDDGDYSDEDFEEPEDFDGMEGSHDTADISTEPADLSLIEESENEPDTDWYNLENELMEDTGDETEPDENAG